MFRKWSFKKSQSQSKPSIDIGKITSVRDLVLHPNIRVHNFDSKIFFCKFDLRHFGVAGGYKPARKYLPKDFGLGYAILDQREVYKALLESSSATSNDFKEYVFDLLDKELLKTITEKECDEACAIGAKKPVAGSANKDKFHPGFVYFVRKMPKFYDSSVGYYKIGNTCSVEERFESHVQNNDCKLKVYATFRSDNCILAEKKAHYYFRDYNIRGEWFIVPDIEIDRYIKSLNIENNYDQSYINNSCTTPQDETNDEN